MTKKTLIIATPETGIRLGRYSTATPYGLPSGFNCLTGGVANLAITDGLLVTGVEVGSYAQWSSINGYVPNLLIQTATNGYGFGFPYVGSSLGTPIPLSATVITPTSGSQGGASMGSGGGSAYSYEVGYTISASASSTRPSTLDIALAMRCNENSAGYVTGNTAAFSVDWVGVTDPLSPTNYAPLANAGTAQNVEPGSVVYLNGRGSSDANGDRLTYLWTLTSKPVNSSASLSTLTSATPTFTADIAGTYVVNLVVNDGKLSSTAAGVNITAAVVNVAPIANAGVAQTVTVGSVVTLNGSASSDANGDPLTYSWTLTSRPSGSAASLSSTTTANPTFTADVGHSYVASLIVSDGQLSSTAATVSITAFTPMLGASCVSCHTSVVAQTHMNQNPGACDLCHSTGKAYYWHLN